MLYLGAFPRALASNLTSDLRCSEVLVVRASPEAQALLRHARLC